MVNIFDEKTGITYNDVRFDAFNGKNLTYIFYVGQSSTLYSIPMDQVMIKEEDPKIETRHDCVPVPVPVSIEDENKFKEEALGLIQSINTTKKYNFVFISGKRVGNFISINKDMMFISVEGSGKVSIPLSWLREITAV